MPSLFHMLLITHLPLARPVHGSSSGPACSSARTLCSCPNLAAAAALCCSSADKTWKSGREGLKEAQLCC